MKLTTDEHRALAFIAALLCLSAAVRIAALPEPVDAPGEGGLDLAAHIEAVEAKVEEAEAMERPLEPGERIDPNTAPVAELVRLPRVGPALADRIVTDREAHGRYRSLADLDRVTGVGERTLEMLAPHVTLRPALSGAASRSSPAAGLDLNRATVEELVALPGIGPVLADRIVAYRDSVGRFHAVSELAEVKGIGPATLSRLGDGVVVR